jgi:uncharacterized protein YkwD
MRASMRHWRFLVTTALIGCGIDPSEEVVESAVSASTELTNGTRVSNLSGARGQEHRFHFDVPAGAGNLAVTIEGDSGDADLYVRFGSEPNTGAYDHRPYLSSSRENVNPPSATSGRWFVMVRGYTDFSALSLTVRWDTSRPSTALTNGGTFSLSASRGAEQHFHLDVPPGAASLRFRTSGGSGDADLYVRFGAAPTTAAWDHRPYRGDANETVEPAQANAGTWHVMVRAYSDYNDVLLEVGYTWDEPARRAFEDRVLVLTNANRAQGADCGGVIYPPAPPLAMNEAIRAAARNHSRDMADRAFFDHVNPDGAPFDVRMRNAGYQGPFPWGENIAAGQLTPEEVVTGWMTSPHHCENVMNAGFRVLGVGYGYGASSPYHHYWTQDFGGG